MAENIYCIYVELLSLDRNTPTTHLIAPYRLPCMRYQDGKPYCVQTEGRERIVTLRATLT
jgi:hypothetical protein